MPGIYTINFSHHNPALRGFSLLLSTPYSTPCNCNRLKNIATCSQGFQRNHSDVTLVATVTILLIVFIIQLCGDVITSLLDKR